MIIKEKFSLKKYNTFGIEATAKYFIEIEEPVQLYELANSDVFQKTPFFILGGGSNVLFRNNFEGIIIHSKINTIEVIEEDEDSIIVKAGSGVIWDDFVAWCVDKNLGGTENLSDIPGSIGAAPVQNIGAYGTEAKDIIYLVEAYSLLENKFVSFKNEECKFSYRWSIFKENGYKHFFITQVTFKLSKKPILNTSYGKIEEELFKYDEKSIKTIRKAIIDIRRSKLPSVQEIGSAGSFFKNPVVDIETAEKLIQLDPTIPHYPEKGMVKISAAWLIEKSGLKGYRAGDTGTYKNQPLVIVNYGNATGQEIADLSDHIRQIVLNKFGLLLEPEVCFV